MMKKIFSGFVALAIFGGMSALAVQEYKKFDQPVGLVKVTDSSGSYMLIAGEGRHQTDRGSAHTPVTQKKNLNL